MWVQWDIERYSISYNWTSVLDNDTWREYVMCFLVFNNYLTQYFLFIST